MLRQIKRLRYITSQTVSQSTGVWSGVSQKKWRQFALVEALIMIYKAMQY